MQGSDFARVIVKQSFLHTMLMVFAHLKNVLSQYLFSSAPTAEEAANRLSTVVNHNL